jgi:hypothetical protein
MRWLLSSVLFVAACNGGGTDGEEGPFFTESMFFNQDASDAKIASNSPSVIAGLRGAGGWGRGDRFHIDFSFDIFTADASTPRKTFEPTAEFYTPDCDHVPMPVPTNGRLEGETGYECKGDGDCHLLVHDEAEGKLYEMWRANLIDASFQAGCLAVWETSNAYGATLRGEQCSSADGAGFPIAPLLFSPDEVASGSIEHAIRFVLPNDRVRRAYVRPATHATDTTGPTNAPPYGVHLRLKAGFNVETLPTEGARVVARALQKYGMYHADGGEYALTAVSDRYSTAKWAGLLGERDLEGLSVEDFEVIDHGEVLTAAFRCMR